MQVSTAGRLVCDITTSLRYEGANAVGIVRVEREIAKALLRNGGPCCFVRFDSESLCFRELNEQQVRGTLGVNSVPAGKQINTPHPPFDFSDDDILFNAGLSWDIPYLHLIYEAKKAIRFRLVQIVYDIIPTIMPEFCVPGIEDKFTRFILNVMWTADIVFCISNCTMFNFQDYTQKIGIKKRLVKRLEMGADQLFDEGIPPIDGLTPGRFVLYVASIEPRKNHITAFHVWRELYTRMGEALYPLILVGAAAMELNRPNFQ